MSTEAVPAVWTRRQVAAALLKRPDNQDPMEISDRPGFPRRFACSRRDAAQTPLGPDD